MNCPGNFIVKLLMVSEILLGSLARADTSGGASRVEGPTSTFPAWAYPWDPKFTYPSADDAPQRVPRSAAAFSMKQTRDSFFSPDWHPDEHPPMPAVVAQGRRPVVHACGSCHRASGTGGGPSVANLSGLPAAYIVQQLADFKSGARTPSGPPRAALTLMLDAAKAATDEEVRAAADYFSSVKPRSNVTVVEMARVPKTHVARNFLAVSGGGEDEPIGLRIIEVPVDIANVLLRDSWADYIAYVPPRSVARGEAIVRTGDGGRTLLCASCHGPDLRGAGAIPGIAGNSPTYLFRQLYDFQNNARAGASSVLMRPVVEKLSIADMIAVAAYLASLGP